MMTRGQVAKRLGVSVAAVRKFEGSELNPEMRDGRWLFEPDEVKALARLRANGGGRLTTPFDEPWNSRTNAGPIPNRSFSAPNPSIVGCDEPHDEFRWDGAKGIAPWFGSPRTLVKADSTPIVFGGARQGCQARESRQRILEERRALSAVDGFLSELERLSPRQLRRFLHSDEDAGELLDGLVRLANDDD